MSSTPKRGRPKSETPFTKTVTIRLLESDVLDLELVQGAGGHGSASAALRQLISEAAGEIRAIRPSPVTLDRGRKPT